jgi:serine/threonine protein kinase
MTDTPREFPPTPTTDSLVDLRRQMLAACERFEWEWRQQGHCEIGPLLVAIPAEHQAMVRSALEELAAELQAENAPPPTSTGDLSERFDVRRPLAAGGMGVVSEAFDRALQRPVALKEILPAGADQGDYRQRFLTEAQITGRLEHPGIIPVYSRGNHPDGRPYYTMRLISGEETGTLQQALQEFHQAPPPNPAERDLAGRNLLRRVIAVCQTMAYAHSQGVLHRDLKPANVLLGPYGETLVVDWGLAKDLRAGPPPDESGTPLSQGASRGWSTNASLPSPIQADRAAGLATPAPHTTVVPPVGGDSGRAATAGLGTWGHASPEQLLGDPAAADPASDIYSLGTILYAVLTGQSPFPTTGSGDPAEMLRKVRAGEFPPPRQLQPAVDPALEAICLRAMAVVPAARYPSALALAEDLERFLANEAVSAWREPWTIRVRRWGARHRTLVSTLGVGLVLTTLAASTVALLQTRNRQALAEEAQKLERALEISREQRQVAERERGRAETQQARAAEAQARAETERGRAVARESLAVRAVDEFRKAVESSRALVQSPELNDLRKELLRRPLEFYRQLRTELVSLPNPSLENLRSLRDATSQLAQLHTELGDLAEAIQLHEQVLELSTQALAHPEANDDRQRRYWGKARVVAHLAIATTVARMNDKSREFQAYERAWQAAEPLAEEDPEDQELNVARASALTGMASTLQAQQRWSEAKGRFAQAAGLHRGNVARNPADPEVRRNLAKSQVNFALLLELLGEPAAAAEAQREADALFEALGDNVASEPFYRHRQATGHFNRGLGLSKRGQLDQALREYRKAATDWRQLTEEFPGNNEYANALRPVLMNLATLLQRLNQVPECLEVLRQLIDHERAAIERNPQVWEFHGHLTEALHMRGHLLVPLGRDDEARSTYAAALSEASLLRDALSNDRMWPRQVVELSLHLANLDQQAGRLEEARERLAAVVDTAVGLVDSTAVAPGDRVMLRSVLGTLAEIEEFRGDSTSAQQRRRLAREWDERDPAILALDNRLREVQAGATPRSMDERLALARRAAIRQEYESALALSVAALEKEPGLARDRQREVGYMAAGLALWLSTTLPEEQQERKSELRGRAWGWLRQELDLWKNAGPEWRVARRAALTRWRFDPSLAVVSRPERREQLPADEQERWRALWDEAAQVAESGSPSP